MPWTVVKSGDKFCVHRKMQDGSVGRKVACHNTEDEAKQQIKALYANESNMSEKPHQYEVFFTDGEVGEDNDDGLVWKDVLKEGEWAYRPGAGQKPVQVPLKVVSGYAQDKTEIGLKDLLDGYQDGAIEHVTVPISHDDKPHENTGFVRKLKIEPREGINYLRAGIEFTEPEIADKARRGSIANTSAGIISDYIKKSSGKVYSQVLGHVALTNKPWINGMAPFGIAASENFSEEDITPLFVTDEELVDIEDDSSFEEDYDSELYLRDFNTERRKVLAKKGQALPDGSFPIVTLEDLRNAIQAFGRAKNKSAAKNHIIKRARALGATNSLPDSWKTNLSSQTQRPNSRRSNNSLKGGTLMSDEVTQTDDTNLDPGASPEVTNDPATDQVELSEEARSLIDNMKSDFEAKLSENSQETEKLRKQLHVKSINERVEQLKSVGFSEYPGLLSAIRNLMLADNGKPALLLSEEKDGKEVESNLTASEVIERIIDAMPKDEKSGKLAFSDISKVDDHDRPKDEPDKTDLSDRAAAAAKFLGVEDYPTEKGGE